MVKKGLMVQIWRIQQSQTLISLFFWSLTLAGVFYPTYFHRHFVNLGLVHESDYLLGTLILFFLIIGGFLLIGIIYDKALRLWREQTVVSVERNPYSAEHLMPKEVVAWRRSNISIMRALAKDDVDVQKDLEFMEKWVDKCLAEQRGLKERADELEKWVMD